MKLIRDKTPDLLRGSTRLVRDTDEHIILLQAKLMEEAAECAASTSVEEFTAEAGDLLQVLKTLAEMKKVSMRDIIQASSEKYGRKGGFDGGLVLVNDPLSNKIGVTV